MLLAGVGWGNMPKHLVVDDIRSGRLKVIRPFEFQNQNVELTMEAVVLQSARLARRPNG